MTHTILKTITTVVIMVAATAAANAGDLKGKPQCEKFDKMRSNIAYSERADLLSKAAKQRKVCYKIDKRCHFDFRVDKRNRLETRCYSN